MNNHIKELLEVLKEEIKKARTEERKKVLEEVEKKLPKADRISAKTNDIKLGNKISGYSLGRKEYREQVKKLINELK